MISESSTTQDRNGENEALWKFPFIFMASKINRRLSACCGLRMICVFAPLVVLKMANVFFSFFQAADARLPIMPWSTIRKTILYPPFKTKMRSWRPNETGITCSKLCSSRIQYIYVRASFEQSDFHASGRKRVCQGRLGFHILYRLFFGQWEFKLSGGCRKNDSIW